jgi:lipid-A-disaccharide synthase
LIGELMVDAAALRRAGVARPPDSRPRIGLFPGSREYMVEFLLPYFAVTVDAVSARHPEVDWLMARADFVRMDFLRQLAPPPEPRHWPAATLRFGEAGPDTWLETPAGNRIRILPGREVLALADLALTIPGTNTGEIAASGTPMVVILPTYRGDEVPLPGLAGHLGRLPLIGKALKTLFGYRLLNSLPLLAQPNRRAGRMIVPELIGTDLHPRISSEIEQILTTDTTALREKIRQAMGRPGASDRLAGEIGAFFGLC